MQAPNLLAARADILDLFDPANLLPGWAQRHDLVGISLETAGLVVIFVLITMVVRLFSLLQYRTLENRYWKARGDARDEQLFEEAWRELVGIGGEIHSARQLSIVMRVTFWLVAAGAIAALVFLLVS